MMRERGRLVFGALAGVAAAYLHTASFRFLKRSEEGYLFIGFLVAGAMAGALVSLFVGEQRTDQPISFNGWCLILIVIALCVALFIPNVG